LAVFFIATCFLAAGLFIGPLVGRELKRQGLWVVILHQKDGGFCNRREIIKGTGNPIINTLLY
jgi:hypothetical protein